MITWLGRTRVLASVIGIAAALLAVPGGATSAATIKDNGVWPLVGKICGSGRGGDASTTRGVTKNAVDIAVFADPGNTLEPGYDIEFYQAASAFASWCNASGGIDGRKIVVHDRDAALFNAAEVTTEACQSDFMSVGGGMAEDEPSVSIRVGCGLGQIADYLVSNQAIDATLQVNPMGTNNGYVSAGFYGALAKAYPKAVERASFGSPNNAAFLQSNQKYEYAAQKQGWTFADWQLPPLMVDDWTPYIQEAQSKGVEALEPVDNASIPQYVDAMNTAGYRPTFMLLGTVFYTKTTLQAASSSTFPPTYVEEQFWPFEMASQSPGLSMLEALMHKYSPGDAIDVNDEMAFDSWVLWAKAATACGSHLTVSCVLAHAATQKNWSAGDIAAPVKRLTMSDDDPKPSACFVLLKVGRSSYVYDKAVTRPTNSIWNCTPSGVVKMPASLSG
jgi:ABC-type branched-subunit amino acid transport system substrate-binding protein